VWPPDSSGSWADWVAGIATFLAVVVALVGLAVERIAHYLADRRVDPSRFTAWLWQVRPHDIDEMIVVISNATEGVIYDVIVMVGGDEANDQQEPLESWYFVAIPPGQYFVSLESRAPLLSDGVDLVFRDARGKNWRRKYSGRLRKVAKSYTPGWAKGRQWPATTPAEYPPQDRRS